MKKLISLFFMCLFGYVLTACDSNTQGDGSDNPEDLVWYKVESGTIDYGETGKLIFDQHGKYERFEMSSAVTIVTPTEQIMMDTENKVYTKTSVEKSAATFLFYGDVVDAPYMVGVGATRSTETIAGKSCVVWSWTEDGETYKYGGWNRLIFISGLGSDFVKAVSFSSSIPANSFVVPSDYVLVGK